MLDHRLDRLGDKESQDVLSRLAEPGNGLTRIQLLPTAIFIATTSYRGMAASLSAAWLRVILGTDDGAIRRYLASRPDLVLAECVRLDSPPQMIDPWVLTDTHLDNWNLQRGDRVYIVLGAANRDPARFEMPESFDPPRKSLHLSLGRGSHACLGRLVALSTWSSGLSATLDRFAHAERTSEPTWRNEMDQHGVC